MHEYCCHIWAGAPTCYLELLDKLQKLICRTAFPSLASSLEPFTHRQNVVSLSLFYKYYFGRRSSELTHLVPLLYSHGMFTRYSDRLHDFSVTILRCCKAVYINSFFHCTSRIWNSLPIERFPLTCGLNGIKSRINRHILTVGSFQANVMYALIFFCFIFLLLHAFYWLFKHAWSGDSCFRKR